MQWSSKRGSIVKLSSVTKGEEKEIVTKVVEKKEPEDNLPNEEQLLISRTERKLAKEREEHRKKLEQMEQEIIAKANAEAEQIREDLEYMGPVRLSSVEEAQQKVVAVIRRLDDAGEIYIGRGDQDAVVK